MSLKTRLQVATKQQRLQLVHFGGGLVAVDMETGSYLIKTHHAHDQHPPYYLFVPPTAEVGPVADIMNLWEWEAIDGRRIPVQAHDDAEAIAMANTEQAKEMERRDAPVL